MLVAPILSLVEHMETVGVPRASSKHFLVLGVLLLAIPLRMLLRIAFGNFSIEGFKKSFVASLGVVLEARRDFIAA